jgi:hypothetical protein
MVESPMNLMRINIANFSDLRDGIRSDLPLIRQVRLSVNGFPAAILANECLSFLGLTFQDVLIALPAPK